MPGYMTCDGIGAITDTTDKLKDKLYGYADDLGIRKYVDKIVGDETPSGMPIAEPTAEQLQAAQNAAFPSVPVWARYALLGLGAWILYRAFIR